jgi:hypothetical protein
MLEDGLRHGVRKQCQFEAMLLMMCLKPYRTEEERAAFDATDRAAREMLLGKDAPPRQRLFPVWVENVWERVFDMCPMPKPMKFARTPELKENDPASELTRICLNCGCEAGLLARFRLSCYRPDEKADEQVLAQNATELELVWKMPLRNAAAWIEGYALGLNTQFFDEQGRPLGHTTAYPIYRALLEDWPNLKTPMSVPELYAWLKTRLPQFKSPTPEQELKHLQMLQQVCRRIRFPLPRRGRPRKRKSSG